MGDPMRGTAWGESLSHCDGQGVPPVLKSPWLPRRTSSKPWKLLFRRTMEWDFKRSRRKTEAPTRGDTLGVTGAFPAHHDAAAAGTNTGLGDFVK